MATAASPITISNEREIQPMQLSLEQLNALKGQHEEEIQDLSKQLESLASAKARFATAKATLLDLGSTPENRKLLVPLNSSLYVPGKIVNPDKVTVELGTGYFCEKTVPQASDLIDRKSQLVAKSIESVESMLGQKRKTLDQLVQIMQYKIQLIQQQRK